MRSVMEKFLDYLNDRADAMANDAGFAGEHGDGGASELREQIEVYQAGLQGTVPDAWREYAEEFDRVNDPEYDEYLRLKEKFEGE